MQPRHESSARQSSQENADGDLTVTDTTTTLLSGINDLKWPGFGTVVDTRVTIMMSRRMSDKGPGPAAREVLRLPCHN
jgi:hypothetical protein